MLGTLCIVCAEAPEVSKAGTVYTIVHPDNDCWAKDFVNAAIAGNFVSLMDAVLMWENAMTKVNTGG